MRSERNLEMVVEDGRVKDRTEQQHKEHKGKRGTDDYERNDRQKERR